MISKLKMTAAHKPMARLWLSMIALSWLTGCTGTPFVGLKPIHPPVKIGFFDLYSQYVPVDSLQPSIQWEPFVPSGGLFIKPSVKRESFKNVTYELRIWESRPSNPVKLVYQREGLQVPFHTVETPLEPDTQYLWSVRAHFFIEGKPRTIEWALAGYTLRDESVPNLSCPKFKTPP